MTNEEQFRDAGDVCTSEFSANVVINDPSLIEINDFMNDSTAYLNVKEARKLREWLDKVIP